MTFLNSSSSYIYLIAVIISNNRCMDGIRLGLQISVVLSENIKQSVMTQQKFIK